MKLRKTIILALKAGILILMGILIAWEANNYYGKREYGQSQLEKIAESVRVSPLLFWEMENEGEIFQEIHDLNNPQFSDGIFFARAGQDPYFYLNLKQQKIDPLSFFYLTFRLYSSADGDVHIYFWSDAQLSEGGHSAPIPIKSGWDEYHINLASLRFFDLKQKPRLIKWGGSSKEIAVLRFDPPGSQEGLEIKIDWIRLKRGSTILIPIDEFHLLDQSSSQEKLKDIGKNFAVLLSRPIAVGSIEGFLDICWEGEGRGLNLQTRTGDSFSTEQPQWNTWSPRYRRRFGSQIANPPNRYIQCRININKSIWEEEIPLSSVTIRYLDSYPVGENSLIFGSKQLITISDDSIPIDFEEFPPAGWIRVLMEAENIYEIVHRLVAQDINILGCFDLEKHDSSDILLLVKLFKSQIRCWELFNLKKMPPAKLIGLIKNIKEIDPHCLILPTRTDRQYFESLALAGLQEAIKEIPTPELYLDRGFSWFLIISICFLIIIVGLAKELDYNFKFGRKEIKFFVLGFLLSAGLNLPLVRLMGEEILRLPAWEELSAAIGRYAPGAVIQEFVRALLIIIFFKAFMAKSQRENLSWSLALLLSSILFAMGHLGYPGLFALKFKLFVAITFIAGMIFGMVFIKTRSLVATSLLHLCSSLLLFTFTMMKI